MGQQRKAPAPTGMPSTRDAWIANGFAPCRKAGCGILIAPSLMRSGFCKTHARKPEKEAD